MPVKDETGKTYGRLTVLERVENSKSRKAMWLCECECGSALSVEGYSLRSSNTESCGCLHRDRAREAATTHGLCGTKLYNIWRNMRSRCSNEGCDKYEYYGARGIKVCAEWEDSKVFLRWAEDKWAPGLQIDRRDNDGNYCPDNCRFITAADNTVNRRMQKNNTSGYVGVTRHGGNFQASLKYQNERVYLGTFPTPWQAAQARNDYIKKNNLPHKIQKEKI